MKVICPACEMQLTSVDVNVAADVANCSRCGEIFALSSLIAAGTSAQHFDITNVPRGVSFEDSGFGWRIQATTRSPSAFLLVPFMCVWSSFALGGIFGPQILAGKVNLLLTLVGVPFLIASLLFGSIAAMTVCGRLVISTDQQQQGRVFLGIGPIGWSRRFDWKSVSAVEEIRTGFDYSGGSGHVIALVGQSRLKFGSLLTDTRRFYILQALRKLLAERNRQVKRSSREAH